MDILEFTTLMRASLFNKEVLAALPRSQLNDSLAILVSTYSSHPRHLMTDLLNAGADPNAVDSKGATPLHLAIRHAIPSDSSDVVRILLDAKADVNMNAVSELTNHYGGVSKTICRPLELCANLCFTDTPRIAALLIERGSLPISMPEWVRIQPWFTLMAKGVGRCLLAARATERALLKSGLLHKDVIPLVVRYVATTRCSLLWNDE